MAATMIPATGKQTAVTLRALEHEVEALTDLPLNELPHPARMILRSIASLLTACRWLIQDQQDDGILQDTTGDHE